MKLIKLMLAIVMALAMVVAQDTGDNPCDPNMTYPAADPGPDGGCGNYADCNGNGAFDLGEPCFENQGPPPCDEWLNSDMAHDMNGDGTVDEGDCPGQGPPPFEDVDTNGDGSIDRDEARAMFGQDDEGNPDPEFDAEYDRIAGDDGVVDHDEYMAADDGGPPTNHWDGNCGAMKHGESEYWLDSDGDPSNGAEDGPYAVWYEDADGNTVDCQPPPNDGNQN